MSQPEPSIGETEARPASLSSHLVNAYNQWKSPSLIAQVGQQSPDWSARDVIYNRAQSKSILLGNVVAMTFGATWCKLTEWQIGFWKELHLAYARQGLRVIGMFLDFRESIPPYLMAHEIRSSFHCCVATEKIKWDFGVNPGGRIPHTALIDRQGIISQLFVGYWPKDSYDAAIRPLL